MNKYFNTYRDMISLRNLTVHTLKGYGCYRVFCWTLYWWSLPSSIWRYQSYHYEGSYLQVQKQTRTFCSAFKVCFRNFYQMLVLVRKTNAVALSKAYRLIKTDWYLFLISTYPWAWGTSWMAKAYYLSFLSPCFGHSSLRKWYWFIDHHSYSRS